MTAAKKTAEQIGELQGRVSQLEGSLLFLMGAVTAAQRSILKLQEYEMTRAKERLDLAKDDVPDPT